MKAEHGAGSEKAAGANLHKQEKNVDTNESDAAGTQKSLKKY